MAKYLPARLLLALTVAGLLLPAVAAQGTRDYGPVAVTLDSYPLVQPSHGYTEYRLHVFNKDEKPHRVTLQIPGNIYNFRGRSGGLRTVTRTVEVEPRQTILVSLLQPVAPDLLGNGLAIAIDGRREEDLLPLSPPTSHTMRVSRGGRVHHWGRGSGAHEHLILTSQRVAEGFFRRPPGWHPGGAAMPGGGGGAGAGRPRGGAPGKPAPPAPPPGPGAGVPGGPPPAPVGHAPGAILVGPGGHVVAASLQTVEGQILRSSQPISIWSDRWLGYTRYDAVVVTREDLDELSRGGPEGRAILLALWRYTETGGTMVVLGPGKVEIPSPWSRTVEYPEPASDPREPADRRLRLYRVGFGLCVVTPDRTQTKWPEERWQAIAAGVSGTGMPWRTGRGLIELNEGFPVVENLGVPVRGLFALLILFGLAIGPLNLIVLSRKNRRIWLLWTVPALSAFFCLIVLGYMVVAEGWTGHARVAGLTLLDEAARRATTLGKSAFYSPLTPGDGLRFSDETEVQLQGNEHAAYTNTCTLDWTGEQHLARGWVAARVPAYFTLRKSEPRRERLNVRREADGSWTVINALGVDVQELWLADEKGQLYSAPRAVVAGDRTTLEHAGRQVAATWPGEVWRRAYTSTDWAAAIDNAIKHPQDYLGPRMYLAVVEETPFLEQGLRGANVRPSRSVVLGMMAEETGKR